MAQYVSEHTKFINELMQKNPEWAEEQRSGRALWWDKPPRQVAVKVRAKAAELPQKPYPYDVNFFDGKP